MGQTPPHSKGLLTLLLGEALRLPSLPGESPLSLHQLLPKIEGSMVVSSMKSAGWPASKRWPKTVLKIEKEAPFPATLRQPFAMKTGIITIGPAFWT